MVHRGWTVSTLLNFSAVTLCVSQGDKPVELAFEDKYGQIRKHTWFGDGYILVAFK